MPKFYQQCFIEGVTMSDRKTIDMLEIDIHKMLPPRSFGVEIEWSQYSENSVKGNVSYLWDKEAASEL